MFVNLSPIYFVCMFCTFMCVCNVINLFFSLNRENKKNNQIFHLFCTHTHNRTTFFSNKSSSTAPNSTNHQLNFCVLFYCFVMRIHTIFYSYTLRHQELIVSSIIIITAYRSITKTYNIMQYNNTQWYGDSFILLLLWRRGWENVHSYMYTMNSIEYS